MAVVAAGCGAGPNNPESWLSDEFYASLPDDVEEAYVAHVRDAVAQEHGIATFVDEYADEQIAALAALWCAGDRTRFSSAIGDELRSRGVELNPGREFLAPPPVDTIMTRVADRHQPRLCDTLG